MGLACRGEENIGRDCSEYRRNTPCIFPGNNQSMIFFSRQCLMRARRADEIIAAKLRHKLQLTYARGDEELRKNRYGGGRIQFTPVISRVRHLRHAASPSHRISAILIHRTHAS